MTLAAAPGSSLRRRRGLASVCVIGLLLSLLVGVDGPASAEAASPDTADDAYARLEAEANRDGGVSVIVRLRTQPTASLAAAQRALRAELTGHRRFQALAGIPFVTMVAGAETVRQLQRSDLVVEVGADREISVRLPAGHAPRRTADFRPPLGPRRAVRADGPTAPVASGTSSNTRLPVWWDLARINLAPALARRLHGRGTFVAVIDSGVQADHPWLTRKVFGEACFAVINFNQSAGACPNGSHTQYGAGAAAPCRFHAGCAHGTHVAHTAAGEFGVARRARILAVQIFHPLPQTGEPTYFESDLLRGLDLIYRLRTQLRIAAVNMSIGGGKYARYCDRQTLDGTVAPRAIKAYFRALRTAGTAPVVASGNNNWRGAMSLPACQSSAVSVGNTTLTRRGADAVYGYASNGSNSARMLKLLAPGTSICSAVPYNRYDCTYTGTSMAAPHVAGAFAILRQQKPRASVAVLQQALARTGRPVKDSRNGLVRARLDVGRAIQSLRRRGR